MSIIGPAVALLLSTVSAAETPAPVADPPGSHEIEVRGREAPAWRAHCPEVAADLAELLGRTDMLVLGEIHGSAEAPAFTLQAVCAALAGSQPVVLGLEVFSGEQERVDAFLTSTAESPGPAGEEARRALLAGPFWARSYQDGRSSVAMLGLLEAARRLVQAGARLSVLCFDEPPDRRDPPSHDRDQAMGRAVLAYHDAHPGRRYVLLMGNIHANVEVGTPGQPDQRPTAWYLDQQVERLVSLKTRAAAGEYWVCAPECGVRRLGGSGDPDRRGILMFPRRGAGWDGVVDIGSPTASPPASRP